MAKALKQKQKLTIWAVDPFESNLAHRTSLAKFLKIWNRDVSKAILPFSVISPGGLAWPIPVSYSVGQDLRSFGEKNVKKILRRLRMRNLGLPKVEVRESSSRRELVNSVLRYAKNQNAGFIAVSTKNGLHRSPWKLGGFAQALVEKSNLPILAVSPRAKVSDHIGTILFPTDLSARSHQAFRKILPLAHSLDAKIQLLNVAGDLLLPYSGLEIGFAAGWILEADAKIREENKKTAMKWCDEAKRNGVLCDYRMTRGVGSIAATITKFAAQKKMDLIALASYREAKTPALLGSTVRSVLRQAETPVMEIQTH